MAHVKHYTPLSIVNVFLIFTAFFLELSFSLPVSFGARPPARPLARSLVLQTCIDLTRSYILVLVAASLTSKHTKSGDETSNAQLLSVVVEAPAK